MDNFAPKEKKQPRQEESSARRIHLGKARGLEEGPRFLTEVVIPETLPILPLRNTVVFPAAITPLLVKKPSSVRLVNEVMSSDRMLGLVAQIDPETEAPDMDDIYRVGVAAVILKMIKLPEETISIIVQGLRRIRVVELLQRQPFLTARIEVLEDEKEEAGVELEALAKNVVTQFQRYVEMSPGLPDELAVVAMNIEEPAPLADFVASSLNIQVKARQELLEILNVRERLRRLTERLGREVHVLELGSKIQQQVQSELDKTQREFLLRQQLEAIRKELGETGEGKDIEDLRKAIAETKMPDLVRKEAEKELDRLTRMHPSSAEYTVSRNYLDWLVNTPWEKSTEDNLNIKQARHILDVDHYDLEKVKERVLEFLAIRRFKETQKGPILCFVGPPGVGKTSLGQSIARSLGRKFIRMSLGGIRDEAEIRGHRRTYIGALPGRIIQEIRRAGTNNPLFMLDEIDKVGADWRGDPSSALLEVLDPEQNYSFTDHYLDVPFDLSKVMFITTGNILDTVPPALRDRLEVLELPGYTEDEKLRIAQQYLIPKQIRENGLESLGITFTEEAIRKIISDYTREAGLRNLEREISNIIRKVAKAVAEEKEVSKEIRVEDVKEYLGPEQFLRTTAERITEPGIAVGLAWTPHGGDVLFVEAARMQGKKGLLLTGQLGDVMKESAQAALSYVRSRARDLKLPQDFFEKSDIHIHIPEGATRKDGPSAGVTLAVALVSILSGRKARPDVAMTGEITLRGKILPVGGIKEKMLAAKRFGIKRVFLPKANEKDLVELPKEVRDGLEFIGVETIDEVVKGALEEVPDKGPSKVRLEAPQEKKPAQE